jgi:hypothetical protein
VPRVWLLGSEVAFVTVRKVCCCAGDAEIAPVVVCTVTPFWTIGTSSVPVIEPAGGRSLIVIFAIIDPVMD